jgi:signal transduction histidine kinase
MALPAAPPPTPTPHRLARTGLIVLGANLLIALLLTLVVHEPFWQNLVYSNLIGLSIWGLVEFGAHRFIRPGANSAPRWAAVSLVAVLLGYVLGTRLASLLMGHSLVAYWQFEPGRAAGMLLVAVLAGSGLTYYFASRTRLAQARAQAEAAQRHAAEAQLRLLESQLEPHMLFNTLANLRALIGTDPARATAMLDRLIAYLRATLSASRQGTHTLRAEFDRLQDYLELMAVRMGPRLHYTLALPPALAEQPVPALLLQPLVENSLRHGLEPKVEGGHVTVRARRDGEQLVLEVSDTGLGLGAPASSGTGFGLAQVRERLATEHGPLAALEFIAAPEGGTKARITFPLKP